MLFISRGSGVCVQSRCFLFPLSHPLSSARRAYHTPNLTAPSFPARHRISRVGNHKQSRHSGREAAAEAAAILRSPSPISSNGPHYTKEEPIPVTGPASPQAYLHRMRHGHFESLLALLSTPYAPPPLRLLSDVLREVMRLRAALATNGPLDTLDPIAALRRMVTALSDPIAVQLVFERAICAVRDAVEAMEAVGDRRSERELQQELQEVEKFVAQLRMWLADSLVGVTAPLDDTSRGLLEWDIPHVVMATVWRALLELSSQTGAVATAVESLNALMELTERVERRAVHTDTALHKMDAKKEAADTSFSVDTVVEEVEMELRHTFNPVTALDHIRAMQSCAMTRQFDVAHSLFRRFMQCAENGAFALTPDDLTAALVALAKSSGHTAHFTQLQELLVASEAAHAVPVSVVLYTALIDAVSRATEHPQGMSIALALYRRLRDGDLAPNVDTYAALIACCATTREPTHAFAFYHEARQQCGTGSFTPAIYTNLLLAYARAGYGADARQTLEVLLEAGASLHREAFHAVLAAAVTPREAEEVLEMMQSRAHIAPTPQTYAFVVAAEAAQPTGVTTALRLYDYHELAMRSLLDIHSVTPRGIISPFTNADDSEIRNNSASHRDTNMNHASTSACHDGSLCDTQQWSEECLVRHYPAYAAAMESALLRLRLDPKMDPRLTPYIRPLLRVAQRRMNDFTEMTPQAPTRVPTGASIAVLAADVLANLEEWFYPFVTYYSAVVIPHSSLVAMRRGGGRRVDGAFPKGTSPAPLMGDEVWSLCGKEQEAMTANRQVMLRRFLRKYRDVVHLVSLEEELAWSRDCDRYGIGVKKTFTRCAAMAMSLARRDMDNGMRLYAENNCHVVLVSANFDTCGRYVVDLKRQLQHQKDETGKLTELAEGMRRVWYHNPRTSPQWRPPQVSVASIVDGTIMQSDK